MSKFCLLISFLIIAGNLSAQTSRELITVNGDSLSGRLFNGENIREVIGHVVLTQGNVRITCNRAVQYLSRNNAILEGNVIVTQDTLVIQAEKGFYYGNEKVAECRTGVKLNDGKVILTAVNGNYYFKEQRAYFQDNVRLYDTVTTMTCRLLNYFKNESRAVAVGNVTIWDSTNTILADSVVHFRDKQITFAEKNVRISNSANNVVIYGNHLEEYSARKYTLITESPLLVQVDTSSAGTKDTLLISSLKMESFNDSSRKFIATDSVKILRGTFASRNGYSVYYRNQGEIITSKREKDTNPPIMWNENTQLSGDSVNIFIKDNRLDSIHVFNNGFILSQNKAYHLRYDQVSGDSIKMYFDSTGLNHTDVIGNVLSIYYRYDDQVPNGLIKSSARNAKMLFKNKAVSEVKLYVSAQGEYYPENLVTRNELTFTLPSFVIYGNRPSKENLLKRNGVISRL